MTKKNAQMFICGPDVIKAATGQTVTMDEIGSADRARHRQRQHPLRRRQTTPVPSPSSRKLLSFLPSNNVMDPPHHPNPTLDPSPDPE
jgi:propionyl-CoA carboxylase beta chain